VIFVDEKRHRQPVLGLELLMSLCRVRADPKHHRIESLEPRESVPERARLDGSARGVILRIEEQDDPPPLEIREGNTTARIVHCREGGCSLSRFSTGHARAPIPG
jgi:hypothetical protein